MSSKRVFLVEIVVVVAVIGLLVALMLPAVQSARDAGRRSSEVARLGGSEWEQVGTASSTLDAPVFFAAKNQAADNPLPTMPSPTDSMRKIIYTAQIDLVTEDLSTVTTRVVELVQKFDGFVADSSVTGQSGSNRRATWKLRVPVARFNEFVDSARELGELVAAKTSSQDVSEEYTDVDARIRNKTKEEERLLKLLEERPGKLEDVIAIERELSRVREELERMQGRMRVLADRTSMTTVTLSVAEVQNYQPEQAATFVTRIRRAFAGSLVALRTAGESLVVAAVAMVPWMLTLVAVLGFGYLAWRPFHRRTAA